MTVPRLVLVSILVLRTTIVAPAIRGQSPPAAPRAEITYEQLMSEDVKCRGEVFSSLTAQNRAALMREHLARWRDRHEATLTSEQRTLIDEWLALVTPAIYEWPGIQLLEQHTSHLRERSTTLLSESELSEVLTFDGPYLPPRRR
jgi:hypothetical protein